MTRQSLPRVDQIRSYLKGRGRFLALGLFLSLLFHGLILLFSPEIKRAKPELPERVPVNINIKKKAKKSAKEDVKKDQQIVEAPLIPTSPPVGPAHLGRQNHKTDQETKVQPRISLPGAPSSALQNGRLKIEGGVPDSQGTVAVPPKKGEKYSRLLPQEGDLLNLAHNDFIPDKGVKKSVVLDVNTTDFRFIGYFTAVRKLVEMAFTDVGPTLRSSPYVQSRLSESGKVSFQGESKIRLKVERSGLLTEAKLVSSSGDKEIDQFWNKILNIAAPYPPLPKAYLNEDLVFTYTLYYDIVVQEERKVRQFIF